MHYKVIKLFNIHISHFKLQLLPRYPTSCPAVPPTTPQNWYLSSVGLFLLPRNTMLVQACVLLNVLFPLPHFFLYFTYIYIFYHSAYP